MSLPTIHGIIDRRILINFTADPAVIQKVLPSPFTPKIYRGKAIVGICLIRLKHIRPKGLPGFTGISSENGAHRFSVEWREGNEIKSGVYIPRRDTSSRFNAFAGGRLFPGIQHLAKFTVKEADGFYDVKFRSDDDTSIAIQARETSTFSANSIFKTLEEASTFFEHGDVGYSPNKNSFEGMQLHVHNWQVKPLQVQKVNSSFYENESIFPKGCVQFDNALLITKIAHEWKSLKTKPANINYCVGADRHHLVANN